MGECDRCGRPAYLTELFAEDGSRMGAYGRECLHTIARAWAAAGKAVYRVNRRRIWTRQRRA